MFPVREAGRVTVGKGAAAAAKAVLISMVLATQVAGILLAQSMVNLVWKQVTWLLKQMLIDHWVPVAPLPVPITPLSAREIGGRPPKLSVA